MDWFFNKFYTRPEPSGLMNDTRSRTYLLQNLYLVTVVRQTPGILHYYLFFGPESF